MRTFSVGASILGALVCCMSLMSGTDARSDGEVGGGGTAKVYGNISPDQIEFLSSNERIISVASSGAPSAIWEALEHGEKVECLACIPAVAPLLYDRDTHTREIAAWWLRRRIFGVFGAGEVYQSTVNTLATDPNPTRRAYAAYALGEFLATPGVAACATAIATDTDPGVRAAAASALGRLNDDGAGAITKALSDSDGGVKLAALRSAGRINTFADVGSVANLAGDGDQNVRRKAVEVLDGLGAKDSVASVLNLAKSDPSDEVRLAACHALGTFGDASARSALENISQTDKNTLVRDQALIAIRQP